MMVLVTYDVSLEDSGGAKRLRTIAKICLDHGVRVQYSVFECEVAPDQWVFFKQKLLDVYQSSSDSLRFYMLGKNWRNRVEHHGAKAAVDVFGDTLII